MITKRSLHSLLVLTCLCQAIATTISKERSIVKASRRIQNNGDTQKYAYDLSDYSIHFDKCQYVKTYDDDIAENKESDSPLATKHFVLFRLCPTNICEQCDESESFGQYATDVSTYLKYTVEQQKILFQNMCEKCGDDCADGQQCSTECGEQCSIYNNMGEAGLIDASNYIECQALNLPQDQGGRKLMKKVRMEQGRKLAEEEQNEDINENNAGGDEQQGEDQAEGEAEQLFIGPICNDSGKRIDLTLFKDENCWQPLEEAIDLGSMLGGELSYYFLDHTHQSKSSVCLTCEENSNNQNQNDLEDADNVNEMCENIYDSSAKCESPNGIAFGFIQTKKENGEYENQVENEFLSCSFINSLLWNSYDEKGEIDYAHPRNVYERHLTMPQGIAVLLLSIWFCGLLTLLRYYQNQLASLKGKTIGEVDNRGTWA